MRVLLTGGTGFIGSALRAVLSEQRHEVVVVSRGPGGDVSWDRLEEETARADAVVHLAGEPIAGARFTAAHLVRVRESRVASTARIAATIEASARRPATLVTASAVGIYGMRLDDDLLDETSPAGDDDVARIGVAWEQAAGAARAAGVRVVHLRFGTVLGRGGGALAKLEAPFRWFVGGPLGEGRQWVSWVHRTDAVRAVSFVLEHPAIAGAVNVVAPEPVRMDDLAREIGRAMHRPSMLRAPAFALRVALGEGLSRLILTGQRVAPRRLLEAGFPFRFPRLPEALADLYAKGRAA